MPSWRWVKYGRQKRGDGIGYSGHKHQKGEKELTITDNHGFIIAPITTQPVNKHDTTILPEAFSDMSAFSKRIGMDLSGSALTLDSGFDSKANHHLITAHGLIPVIYPNRRNAKEPIVIARMFRWFRKEIYKDRYKVERTFGWQDTYRKLALSYDTLKETRLGFRLLAYSNVSLINN
ncbi:transposase [Candidatus Poribacteria bacterium]|nr:transposase [Candidatus Poribacteria bacterium]MYA56425.1 transposase [Candidatus Poribacteria bacterium]